MQTRNVENIESTTRFGAWGYITPYTVTGIPESKAQLREYNFIACSGADTRKGDNGNNCSFPLTIHDPTLLSKNEYTKSTICKIF